MDATALINNFRNLVDDIALPYLWSDTEIVDYLNEAQREACLRARLLRQIKTIVLTPGQGEYDLSLVNLTGKLIDIDRMTIGGEPCIDVRNITNGDCLCDVKGKPTRYDLQFTNKIVLYPVPDKAYVANVVVVHLPLMDIALPSGMPEIPDRYHRGLIYWAAKLAYEKRDEDVNDPTRVNRFAQEFELHFGFRHDANVRRKHLTNRIITVRGEQ